MNQINIHTEKIKTFSQWLSVFLCCFWLISSLTTITHNQTHVVIEEYKCQFCLENEDTSSEKTHCQFCIPFIPVINGITEHKNPLSTAIFQILLGNRDPPSYGTFNYLN